LGGVAWKLGGGVITPLGGLDKSLGSWGEGSKHLVILYDAFNIWDSYSQSESQNRWSSNVLACDNIGRSLGRGNSIFWETRHILYIPGSFRINLFAVASTPGDGLLSLEGHANDPVMGQLGQCDQTDSACSWWWGKWLETY